MADVDRITASHEIPWVAPDYGRCPYGKRHISVEPLRGIGQA